MNVPERENCASAPASLETMELEFALGTRVVAESGFEYCVTKAAEETGARVLFQLPVFFLRNCQRAAAVLCGNGSEKNIVLALLDADGRSIRIETAGEDNPVFCLAHSYVRLLDAAQSASPPVEMVKGPFGPGGGRDGTFAKARQAGTDATSSA